MHFEAFAQLQRILTKIEDDNMPFDLRDWSFTETKRVGPWWRRHTEECDTTFCLMGWAAQDPWFIERGFRLGGAIGEKRIVIFGESTEWEAVANFLGIDEDEALFLLDGANYGRDATPSEVALRLRAFVRSKTRVEAESVPALMREP